MKSPVARLVAVFLLSAGVPLMACAQYMPEVLSIKAPARDAAPVRPDDKLAESLMKKSGLWQQFDGFSSNVQKAFSGTVNGRGPELSASEMSRVDKVIAQAFDASLLRASALKRMTAKLEAPHVPRVQAWYDSALGARITAIELTASRDTRDSSVLLGEGEAAFAQLPPSRRALLERLVAVTRSGEAITNIVINTTLAVQMGFRQAMPNAPGPSLKELRDGLQLQRPQLVTAYERYATVVSALTYKSLSEADLASYVVFLATPGGQHFTDLSLRAFDDALVDAAARFGRGLSAVKDNSNT